MAARENAILLVSDFLVGNRKIFPENTSLRRIKFIKDCFGNCNY